MESMSDDKITKDGVIFSDEIITEKEAYNAMLDTLKLYFDATRSNDFTDILSGSGYLGGKANNKPMDTAYWAYWLEASEKIIKERPVMDVETIKKSTSDVKTTKDNVLFSDEMITEKEGYDVMLAMLYSYFDATKSRDIPAILSGGGYWGEADNKPTDTVYWKYWLEALEKVKKERPPVL